MPMNYKTLFQETGVFEENPYQKIVMATRIGEPRQIFVINCIVQDKVPFFDYSSLKDHLTNLSYIEQADNTLVLVTAFKEGQVLAQFTEEKLPTLALRESLAEQYLIQLQNYAQLPLTLQYLLADAPQYIVHEDKLIANELLILDRKLPVQLGFEKVKQQIHNTLAVILTAHSDNKAHPLLTALDSLNETVQDLTALVKALLFSEETYIGRYDVVTAAPLKSDAIESNAVIEDFLNTPEPSPTEVGAPFEVPPPIEVIAPINDSSVLEVPPVVIETLIPEEASMPKTEAIVLDTLYVTEKTPPEILEKTGPHKNHKLAMILVTAAAVILAIVLGTTRLLDGSQTQAPIANFQLSVTATGIQLNDTSQVFTSVKTNALKSWQWEVTRDGKKIFSSQEQNPKVPISESGLYSVKLKVKDTYKWSSEKIQEVKIVSSAGQWVGEKVEPDASASPNVPDASATTPSKELLLPELFTELSPQVQWDLTQFNTGIHSLKLDLNTPGSSASFSITPENIARLNAMSFYLFSTESTQIDVRIEAFNGSTRVAVEALQYTPQNPSLWDLVNWAAKPEHFNTKNADRIQLTFSSKKPVILWIDDFSFGAYK